MSIISSLARVITKGRKIRFKQGLEANLPSDLDVGEPAFTTDKKNVYIGSDSGNVKMLTEADTLSVDDIPLATTTTDGLMPKDDKLKLNGISAGANHTTVIDNLTSTSTTSAASANQVRVLKGLIDNIDTSGEGNENVTQAEKDLWNAKSDFSGDFNDLLNKPTIPLPVVLNDTLTSTSKTEGATTNAVKTVYDLALSKSTTENYTATLSTIWTGTVAPFTQTVTVNGILSTDNPIIYPVYSSVFSTAIEEEKTWNNISSITTSNGTLIATCFEENPTTALNIQLKVVR